LILRAQGAYHLVLAGLDQVSVAPGQSVAPGATVGRMASHGSDEPELYFEVREDGAPVDPERWLKQGSR
jgi:septal ring factor EnvC (AmiA/AmiB activator)